MHRSVLLASLILGLSPTITAQEADTEADTNSGTRTYTPEDFTQYAPRTALDMVRQIPGFRLDGGDTQSRGFGQATGNVLINGQRISGKSNSAIDALGRITASSVEKIEILDGASLDIPGLSGQVVNVISAADGTTGTWNWNARFREGNTPRWYSGEISANGKRGVMDWTLSFESDPFRNGHRGPETVTDGAGLLTETRDEDAQYYGDNPSVSVALAWKPESGTIANFNASYGLFNFLQKERSVRTPLVPVGQPVVRRLFEFSEDEWNAEIGGDYEFDMGPGRLKFIGLQRLEHSPTLANFIANNEAGTGLQQSQFERVADESETIARSEYSWAPSDGRDWQVSFEGAFNTLEIEAALTALDANGILAPVTLNNATSTVEERRAEATLTHGRTLSPKLSIQASLGAEYSELTQSGAAGQERTFTRPKGFLSAAYKPSEDTTINLKVAREVGQLNFFDFISSVNINNNNSNAGNPDLVPEQSWEAEIEIERDFGDKGAGTLRVFGEAIEDIVDRVPIGATGEAPGNLDSARRYGIEATGTIKLDPWGWEGAQIEFEGEARQSSIDDPLTGISRRINGDLVSFVNANFRHDVAKTDWAWGFGIDRWRNARNFRLDESFQDTHLPGFAWAFVEHKDVYGMTATVTFGNLLDMSDNFQRDVYTPRRDGVLLFSEDRERKFGDIFTFELSGSF